MNTGDRIKQLRNEIGLTQEELGEILGVKKAAIQKYENGSIVNLKVDTIKKLSDIFKVSPNYIIGWEDEEDHDNKETSKLFNDIVVKYFGSDLLTLIRDFYVLNANGKRKITEYTHDISKINDYVDGEKVANIEERYKMLHIE